MIKNSHEAYIASKHCRAPLSIKWQESRHRSFFFVLGIYARNSLQNLLQKYFICLIKSWNISVQLEQISVVLADCHTCSCTCALLMGRLLVFPIKQLNVCVCIVCWHRFVFNPAILSCPLSLHSLLVQHRLDTFRGKLMAYGLVKSTHLCYCKLLYLHNECKHYFGCQNKGNRASLIWTTGFLRRTVSIRELSTITDCEEKYSEVTLFEGPFRCTAMCSSGVETGQYILQELKMHQSGWHYITCSVV